MFATFVKENEVKCVFLGLLVICDGKEYCFNFWTIDDRFERAGTWCNYANKYVVFCSNSATTIVGLKTCVKACLKKEVKPFFTIVHCVGHPPY